MPHAGHFKVKSSHKRLSAARNKKRAEQRGVSKEEFAKNWDRIFGTKDNK
jgi:hypothetical protein|tara:strand:- start:11574 stop:11723 length:150 start_codon:yes stop_codon:yes gene_type:complete